MQGTKKHQKAQKAPKSTKSIKTTKQKQKTQISEQKLKVIYLRFCVCEEKN